MRHLLVIAAVVLCLTEAASAQFIPTANGSVTMDIAPSKVDLTPDAARTVTAWVNATIQCSSGYSPTTPVTVRADPRSLEDDNGDPVWVLEPSSITLEFVRTGDRFDARQVVNISVGAGDSALEQTGTIPFEVLWSGSGTGSNDCSMFGMSWQMQNEPHIDVTLRPGNDTREDHGFVETDLASMPSNASVVVVEGGPVEGESHIPGEAFWSLGIVFGLFASTAVYSWRKR